MSVDAAIGPLVVVHVTAPAPVGGLESVVTALARGHAERGHRVHVISVFNVGDVVRPLAAGLSGVTTHVIEVPARRYWRERTAVTAVARAVGAEIVHTHGYRPDVVDAAAARRLGVPGVTTVHGFTGGGLKNRVFERLQVRALRRLDAVIAVSQPQVEHLLRAGVPAGKVHCIQNAWAPAHPLADRARARAQLGLPADETAVGWVGRLSREKGPDVFLEALGLLAGDAPVSAFIGDGPEAAALRARAEALGVADRMRWCGRVAGAAGLLAAFDLFVLSSRTEGTPIALFEAMAAGVPVIATTVGGVPDVVSDAEAVLVPPDDSNALAEALRAALADPAGSAARASAARARLERDFAAGPWLARYEVLYRDVIRARRIA